MEEVGVAYGGRREGGVLQVRGGGAVWVGCRGPACPRRCMGGFGWAWLGWALPVGLVGERWALGCRGWLWRGCLSVGPAGLLGSVLEAYGRRWGGVCGARSRLVDFWVMHGMVMDETQPVFPGGGVGELFCVCQ